MIALFYHHGYAAPLGDHIMPIRKFGLVAERLAQDPRFDLREPIPVTRDDLARVHTPEYIDAIATGVPRDLAESQKFPWSPELFSSVCLTSGGLLGAATVALERGVAGALVSGFHHSCADHGEGFCTFNGLVVVLEILRARGLIRNGVVLDMDLHYGNGTAALASSRPWMRAISIYGNDYRNNVCYRDVSVRHHEDGVNHVSFAVSPTGGSDRGVLMEALEAALQWITAGEKPDILLYQAGADPLEHDPYSPLRLTHEDLKHRDAVVFRFARDNRVPIAWVLAGGYTPDVTQVVEVHVNTADACAEVFSEASSPPK